MARDDMFSWLLGKKKRTEDVKPTRAATIEPAGEGPTATAAPQTAPATNTADTAPKTEGPSPVKVAAAMAASAAAEAAAKAGEVLAQPPVAEAVMKLPEVLPAESEAPPAAAASASPQPPGVQESGDGETAVATKSTSVASEEGSASEPGTASPSKWRAGPAVGMSAVLYSVRNHQEVRIDSVSASGRRILVSTPGSSLRRPYTLRRDGSYRLEGAPDGAGAFIALI